MRSIERRFKKLEQENPSMSSLGVFITTINGQSFREESVLSWFKKLVDKEDYDSSAKRELIEYLKLVNKLIDLRPKQPEGRMSVARNKDFLRV